MESITRRKLLFSSLGLPYFLAGCAGSGGVDGGSEGTVRKIWEYRTGNYINSSPAIGADGTVYIGGADNTIYAFNGVTGQKKWEFKIEGVVWSSMDAEGNVGSPAIGADGTVYIGSWDNKLYAIDGITGQKKWEFITGGWVSSSPAIGADGTVYVGSFDYKLYAIDGVTGQKKWEFVTEDEIFSSPVIGVNGIVYFGCQDYKFYAIQQK